jgi:U4/U6.U5 tri-snRNP-associated protein 2
LVGRATSTQDFWGRGQMKRQNEEHDEQKSPENAVSAPRLNPQENQALVNEEIRLAKRKRTTCPYLDTVNRSNLDFDFEKICSVSLSTVNVYACLVCGKYFQGRGRNSYAYIHSLEQNHHVFINLNTKRIYCLPEDYEVIDSSLDDIKRLLSPTFTREMVASLDREVQMSRTLDGNTWVVGVVGLHPLNQSTLTPGINQYFLVSLLALANVPTLRDFFLLPDNYAHCKSELVQRFGTLIRKIWSPYLFRNHVSPHELLQEITIRSAKKFKLGSKGDPFEFLTWFLNTLHEDLVADQPSTTTKGGVDGPKDVTTERSIITECFQGRVEVDTERERVITNKNKPKKSKDSDSEKSEKSEESSAEEKSLSSAPRKKIKRSKKEIPFLILPLDMPPPPLFRDESERNIIPQEPIFTLLNKFNGIQTQYFPVTNERKKYRITQLPRYLIVHIKRFTKNVWFTEKNPTIVTFPLKSLDLSPYTTLPPHSKEPTQYDLLANIRHEGQGKANEGTYAIHIYHKANNKWYNIQDLYVEEAMPQLIALSEAYIQIFRMIVCSLLFSSFLLLLRAFVMAMCFFVTI